MKERAHALVTVTPDDRQYPDLTSGRNQRWVAKPESVVLVETTAQVVHAVQHAVRAGKRITVGSGGHCVEDFVYSDNTQVIIDMGAMQSVYFDPERNAVAVEAGAILLDVYEKLYEFWGVTIPAGICYSVGAGGHVSGGGWGALCRRYGLVVDHLYAVEVVVVDAYGSASVVVATREESDPNRELWWAHTGGGGGNFGVVTRYWFRTPGAVGTTPDTILPKPPRHLFLNAMSFPWSDVTRDVFATLVHNYGTWHAENADPASPYAGLWSVFMLNHQSNGQIGLITQADASVDNAEQLLEDYLAAITRGVDVPAEPMTVPMGDYSAMPEVFVPRRLPWLRATRYVGTNDNELNNPTVRGDYKSGYMRHDFPDRHVTVMYDHLTSTDIDNPSASMHLQGFGGQVNTVESSATAFPHRDSVFKLFWQIQWNDSREDAKHLTWLRSFYSELYSDTGGVPVPNDLTDGCYVNYPDIDLSDPGFNQSSVPWYTLYYKDNYERLQRVKGKWDPGNVFRHNQSIELPTD